ncbi:MAG: cyclic pyranopterin monophosphate synthase MoaC [Acidobacteriota bacterium]|nr:cyclic pyranopterin monophosphate synthase MoaC [Acidobacteriota bacterium]
MLACTGAFLSSIRSGGEGQITTMAEEHFSHLDPSGRAQMVDVSRKPITRRVAEASCRVQLSASTVDRLSQMPKGDALTIARLAGIQAAKRTGEIIPLAHALDPELVEIDVVPKADGVLVSSRVVVTARTGAEMEALVGCAAAALALYDMVKAIDRGACVTDLRLDRKSGGQGGDYRRQG